MAKSKGNPVNRRAPIALLFGGEGGEREISCLSAVGVAKALDELSADYIGVYIDPKGYWYILGRGVENIRRRDLRSAKPAYPARLVGNGCGFITDGEMIRVSSVIPVLHGDMGEDGVVQGALRCAGIPYLGSDTYAGSLLMDKAYTKLLAEYSGIPTVPWFLYVHGERPSTGGGKIATCRSEALAIAERLGYPLFVKPARSGSSIGAAGASCPAELIRALKRAASVCTRVIVEKMLPSPVELECAFLDMGKKIFLSPGSIVSRDGFYSYGSKYGGEGRVEIKAEAQVSDDVAEKIKKYSEAICLLSGAADFARIDFFLSEDELYFNEINTFPGMTEDSLFPRMTAHAGIPLKHMLTELLRRR